MTSTVLVAQKRVQDILAGIVRTGRVAGGYIFVGPRQSGKTTAAKEFYELLNGSASSIDLVEINPEGKIKIETIRELRQHVQYGPRQNKFLIVIIQQADRLTAEAANSFLKILEEPPAGVCFILETAQPDALPRTILSRCQQIIFDQTKFNPELQDPLKYEKIRNFVLAKQQRSFGSIVELVEFLGRDKQEICSYLNVLLCELTEHRDLGKAKVLREYLKILQKNVNLKLTLETLFLRVREI